AMTRPTVSPIVAYPVRPPPATPTTRGAAPPATRMPRVRKTIRQTMIRVRTAGTDDISAGRATYGTWKSEKALAASTKVTVTQTTAPAPVIGDRNIAANAAGR